MAHLPQTTAEQPTGFRDRAAVRSGRGFRYPTGFAQLKWQRFVRLLDKVQTGRAMKRLAEDFRK